jgi:hypothetical protein
MTLATNKTRIRNTSGGSLPFNLVGTGVTLAANAELDIPGNIFDAVRAGRGKSAADRNSKALDAMLEAGQISIISTPLGVFYDATDDLTKQQLLKNGKIYFKTPEWDDGTKFSSSI